MIRFTTTIKQFSQQGEKTGWTYIEIPAVAAQALKPGNKKSFRVKGKLDAYPFEGLALIPMGGGNFILALNAAIRKEIKKRKGAAIIVQLAIDANIPKNSTQLLECLHDEPTALNYFNSLAPSHQLYFSRWIESAKTESTKARRIANSVEALSRNWDYVKMIRALKKDKSDQLPLL
jgi:hypothetical protein